MFNGMNEISEDLCREIFKYLDTKSQYNFFLMNKFNSITLQRNLSHNSIKYLANEIGLSRSDLYNNFFVNYIREDSLNILKEIINIFDSSNKKKIYFGFPIRYIVIKRKNIDECKSFINQYKTDSRISKFMLRRKREYFSNKYFNKSLYRQSRNVYLILI